MLLINDIRADKEGILTRLAKRGVDFTDLVNSAVSLDDKRKSTQVELDNILAEANKISKEIGQLFAQKKIEEANAKKKAQLLRIPGFGRRTNERKTFTAQPKKKGGKAPSKATDKEKEDGQQKEEESRMLR